MLRQTKKTAMAIAALAAFALGGAAFAGAAAKNSSSPSGSSSSSQSADPQGGRSNETPLTGDTAAKVKAAAEAKVPGGTVNRVETDNGGTYEAHVTKSDGTEVEVKVDNSFAVTSVDQHGHGGPGGRDGDGPGHGGGHNETPLTGDTAAKVKAAAQAKVPGGTVNRVETDNGGTYEAHVTKSDGTEVEVKVDKSFAVTSIGQRPAHP